MATTPASTSFPGSRVLQLGTSNPMEIDRIVRLGFPTARLKRFQKAVDLPWDKVATITAIQLRTLNRRQNQPRLHPDESDRLWRAARIFDLAVDLFEGDTLAARHWLLSPQPALADSIPFELASTDIGARQVETLIGQLEHGVLP